MNISRMLVCAVICFAASQASAQDYEIRLTRPNQAGEKFELAAIGSKSVQTTTKSTDGQILHKAFASVTVKLEGTVTILQIGPLKQVTKLRVTISECMVSRDGEEKEREALPEGTQVVVQLQDGKTEFLINGRSAPQNIADILSILFSIHQSNINDDDVFGTKERKRIGDTWPINSEKAAAALAENYSKAEAADIKGATTLDKMMDVDGVQCLRITAKMALTNFVPKLPPELTLEKSTMSMRFSGDFPIDISLDRLQDEISMTGSAEARGRPEPGAPEVRVSVRMDESRSAIFTPLKK